MSLECGIVGLPNVGKSTLFNALTASQVPAENFPFCTVDPHKGIVYVPDPRMDQISAIVKPVKTTPAMVTFVDIAGLVKGASAGEGLGNQFLSHIREVNAIVHVVRCFEDPNVIHVMGDVDPQRDVDIINLELCLSDLDTAQRRLDRVDKLARANQADAKLEAEALRTVISELGSGIPVRRTKANRDLLAQTFFLTSKPVLYVANICEADVKNPSDQLKSWLTTLGQIAATDNALVLPLSIHLESELRGLSGEDLGAFLTEYGLTEPGLNRLIREAYKLLGLITFFTAGVKEVRAWTIKQGTFAPQAAGVIHTDFERGFIRADTIALNDFLGHQGEKGAREKGLQRSEGKEYVVHDGDIILFKFAV